MGSLKYAASYPELFGGVAVISSTIQDPRGELDGTIKTNPLFTAAMLKRADDYGELEDYLESYDNIWGTLKKNAARMPKLFYIVGSEDHPRPEEILPNLRDYTRELGIDGTFEVIPNHGHTWYCFDAAIKRTLEFFEI